MTGSGRGPHDTAAQGGQYGAERPHGRRGGLGGRLGGGSRESQGVARAVRGSSSAARSISSPTTASNSLEPGGDFLVRGRYGLSLREPLVRVREPPGESRPEW